MTYSEIKEICFKLEKGHCYFRHPKKDFIDILGKEVVDEMVLLGFIKDSEPIVPYWNDFREDCYEFGNIFRRLYNFIVTPKWLWFKVYVLQLWRFRVLWQRFRIFCGHHYVW